MPETTESFWGFVGSGESGCDLNCRKVVLGWVEGNHTEDRETSWRGNGRSPDEKNQRLKAVNYRCGGEEREPQVRVSRSTHSTRHLTRWEGGWVSVVRWVRTAISDSGNTGKGWFWRKAKSLVLYTAPSILDSLSLKRTAKFQCRVGNGKTGLVLQREIRTLTTMLAMMKWTCLYFWAEEL